MGEPINETATFENKSNKDINLYYGSILNINSVELKVNIERLIKEPFSTMNSRAAAELVVPVEHGEKCVQNYKYHTYTGSLQEVSEAG